MSIEAKLPEKCINLGVDAYKKYLLELTFINERLFEIVQRRNANILYSERIKDKRAFLLKHDITTPYEEDVRKRVGEITQILLHCQFDSRIYTKELEVKPNSIIKTVIHNPYEDVEQFLVLTSDESIINNPWNCYAMYGARVKFVKPDSALEKFLIGKKPLDVVNLQGKTGGYASIIYVQNLGDPEDKEYA